ncbi:hypothetical protein E2C01_050765 [Portunus trituberculatus]|uniref:Peptidase A2 domain-containing protein n=1 Tax=Portunus trituberculatus TaxID=210409 RepID=A0A5B7GIE0_PORTR|nr:hypothetical protein [Portunus trituberculatus]
MADSDVRDSEMPESSEPDWKRLENLFAGMLAQAMNEMKQAISKIVKQETSEMKQDMSTVKVQLGLMQENMGEAVGEARQFTLEHKRLWQDLSEEFKEDLVACKGRTRVVESQVDGRPCPVVVDTGAAKAVVGEEVVAAQDLPVSDRQLCGVTGHCTTLRSPVMSTITVGGVEEKLPVFVAHMEEPCLLELDSLVQRTECVDLGRMQTQVHGKTVPLIIEDAAEQVESPVTSSDVEDERLELHSES